MATTRTYDDGCAAAHALDLVGERWALLVVRELLLGPKRFTDLRSGLPHASPNVLAQRLRDLEAAGVVRRGKLPPPAASKIYELTEWGRDLEPVIIALGRWGVRSPTKPPDAEVVDGRLEIERGTAEPPDATVEADAGTLAALVYDDLELDDALGSGDLRIKGDRDVVERFLTLFPLPEPAAVGV